MSDHEKGQVAADAAVVYDELFVPALFGRFASAFADAAAIGATESVVDVACGTGALTRELRARTTGDVIGVDVNPGMLDVARRHGGDITYREADALSLPFEDRSVGLATCQFGVMFYPDPAAGIAEMARIADRGVVAVWGPIASSDGYLAMQELFSDELGPDAAESLDAPFSMGADGVLEGLAAAAGVDEAEFTTIDGTGGFSSVDQWITTEVRGWTLGDTITDDQLAHLINVGRQRLARFATPDGCEFTMSVKLARWR